MASHEGVHHDYHLVNPSPWPLVGSFFAVVFTAGMVVGMKGCSACPRATG
jgi:cytochrome c oxidase subunit 3